jgi:alkylation response protein AidB-like acyl-CoA dehydrogenase
MDLIPDDQQQQIIDIASSYLENELPLSRLHGEISADQQRETRKAFADMGWLAIGLPEDAGGTGLSVLEEAFIFRELGRVVGPTAALPIVLAAKLAHECGLAELRDALTTGEEAAALAIAEAPLSLQENRVAGVARIYDIADASVILVEVDDEVLLLDAKGAEFVALPWLDPGTPVARTDLTDFPVLARKPAEATRLNGMLLTAAMLVGLSEGAVAMIQEYAKIRETFGRKIGAYQAVRHPIAEGAARSEHAKALLYFAGLAVRDARADAELQARSAKVIAHRAATRNADINIQLHGGIGITDDLAAHHFMKRSLMLSAWFGGRKSHLDALLHTPLQTI